jgi:hypothetical protein
MVMPNVFATFFQTNCQVFSVGAPYASGLMLVNTGAMEIPAGHRVTWVVPPSIGDRIIAGNLGTTAPNQSGVYTFGAPLAPGGTVFALNIFDAVEVAGAFCSTQATQ